MKVSVKHMDKEDTEDVTYLDFQRAFERASKETPLSQVLRECLSRISNWLKNRKQRVGLFGCFAGRIVYFQQQHP